ncbi:MAG: hypothetical protein RLY40_1187, partial [Pseudomonadota bacterium]
QSIMLKSGLSPSACFVTLNTSHSATIVMFRLKKPIEEKERVNLEQELFLTVRSACRRNGISESEIPVKVVIDDINDGGWSLENGILNRSMKIIRPKLQIRLENIITKQSIYTASITSAQDYPKTPAELASWLLHKLQPEIDSCCNEHMLASLLIHIGFDSIQFTKMSAMLPELLDELRNRGNINIKEMQNKQFATPILMKHSMLSLAQIIWDENPEISLVEPNKKEISLLDRLTEVEKNSIEHLQQLKAIPSLSKIKYFKQQNMLSANRKRVLITGGAGFLGAHIVRDLLNDPSVSEIICLVRGSEKEEAASRVSRIVLAGDHESLSQLYSQKIKVVDGDLSKDKFGLQESDYDALIHDNYGNPAIDLIIHAAAMIKTWGLEEGLDTLMGPNVQGTLRIVQLAFESSQYHDSQQLTPIVYVSTISVCCDEVCSQDKTRETHLESWFATFKDKSAIKRNFNAYAITKWMGEQILRESGLPLTIVRAPLLTWNTKTGYGNDDDWLNRLVDACISTRMIPQFDPEASVKAISVDQCSMLIRQYAKSLLENAENHPFTITYPHQGVPGLSLSCLFKKLAEQAQANKIIMTSVSIIDWHRELDSRSYTHPTRFHPLLTMLAGINDKRSGTDELSQMEGIYYWLQHLLSSMPIERPSNTTVRLNDPKKLHLAFFKRSAPKKLSQANTSHSICALS